LTGCEQAVLSAEAACFPAPRFIFKAIGRSYGLHPHLQMKAVLSSDHREWTKGRRKLAGNFQEIFYFIGEVREGKENGPLRLRQRANFILFLPYFGSRALRRHDLHECPYQSLIPDG